MTLVRTLAIATLTFSQACDSAESLDAFSDVQVVADTPLGPPSLAVFAPRSADINTTIDVVVQGGLGEGETVFLVTGARATAGPCPPALGGSCLSVGPRARILDRHVVTASDLLPGNQAAAHFAVTIGGSVTPGDTLPLQAVVVRGIGGRDSLFSAVDEVTVGGECFDDGLGGPPEFDLCEVGDDWTQAVTVSCTDQELTVRLRTNNWGFHADLYMAETLISRDWDELHPLTETEASPAPDGFSLFETTLRIDVPFASHLADPEQTTIFGCNELDPDDARFRVTYAAVVRNPTGGVEDCIVFGQNPVGLIQSPGATLPGKPAWLTAANCRVY